MCLSGTRDDTGHSMDCAERYWTLLLQLLHLVKFQNTEQMLPFQYKTGPSTVYLNKLNEGNLRKEILH